MVSTCNAGHRRVGVTAIALAAGLAIAMPAPAGAAADTRPNCQKQPEACKAVTMAPKLKVKIADQVSRGRQRCKGGRLEMPVENVVGIKLFTWTLDVHWCYRRGRITQASSQPRWETHFPFWSFSGVEAHRRRGGRGKTFYRVYAEGEFSYCLPVAGCVQEVHPWISLSARGDGSFNIDNDF